MTTGVELKDFSGDAKGYFAGIRTPAALIVGSTLGALFIFSKASFGSENRSTKLFLGRLYNALMLASFSLSFTTMILSTTATVSMLHGRFDPMAETAYLMLRREFDFEFTLTRWAFIMALLFFLSGIIVRAIIEFDLLKRAHRNHAIGLILVFTSLISQMLSYINTTLWCWPNLLVMSRFVIEMTIKKCVEEKNPLQIISVISGAVATVFIVRSVFKKHDDDDDHGNEDKNKKE